MKAPFYQDIKKYEFFKVFPGKFLDYNVDVSSDKKAYDDMLERQRRKYKNPSSVDSDTEGVVTNT
jgi:hypothetical protein